MPTQEKRDEIITVALQHLAAMENAYHYHREKGVPSLTARSVYEMIEGVTLAEVADELTHHFVCFVDVQVIGCEKIKTVRFFLDVN